MRILTCKLNHSIAIGDDIEITLVQVQLPQDQVRLGIAAPRSVNIYRREVLLAIRQENRRATQASPDDLSTLIPPPNPTQE
jgi:carbon storage regulator